MPTDWNLSALCSVLKKGDSTICANYRGISLLPIAYKVLTSILCESLKFHVIGPYLCGFRPGNSNNAKYWKSDMKTKTKHTTFLSISRQLSIAQ